MLATRGAVAAAAAAAGGSAVAAVPAAGWPRRRDPHQRRQAAAAAGSRKRVRPSSAAPTTPSSSSSCSRRPCCAVRALWGNNNNGSAPDDDGGVGPFNVPPKRSRHAHNSGRRSAEAERRRRALLDYALGVKPSAMDEFAATAPAAVLHAMRSTCANMLGTLPPAYFEVRVLTSPETLAHLFFSAAMTGWMFRNCVLRLELRSALAGAALDASPPPAIAPPPPLGSVSSRADAAAATAAPAAAAAQPTAAAAAPSSSPSSPSPAAPPAWSPAIYDQYAPGAQKHRVEGDVLLWHNERGVEKVAARGYMEGLEQEVARLRSALADALGAGKGAARAAAAAALVFEAGGGGAAGAPVASPAAAVGGGGEPAALQVVPPMRGAGLAGGGGGAGGSGGGAAGGGGSGAPGASSGANPLLEYLRALDPASLKDLTAGIGDGAAAAVDAFVARMLGVASARDGDALRRCDPSECSASELGRALFWLMVVGYTLRSLEMRLDMDGVKEGGGLSGLLLPGKEGGGGGMPFGGWKWPSL